MWKKPRLKNMTRKGNMDFLKDVLGDDLFGQVADKINAYNGDEANKDKQIKLANLALGQYVNRDKFASKETELDAKIKELAEANSLIDTLKKGTKDNDTLQSKIAEYDSQINKMQEQLIETKVKSALKIALMSEKALDVDYLSYKLNEKLIENGNKIELDDNDNIKNAKELIDGLKVQFPTQFEKAGEKKFDEHKLPQSNNNDMNQITSMSDALKEHYESKG